MIVRCGVFYDGTLEKPRENVDLRIENGTVATIGPAEGDYDLSAACVTPGLVNAHAHFELNATNDTVAEITGTTPSQRMLICVENARKALRAGVTTVRDVGCSGSLSIDLRDAVDSGRVEGPRIRAAGSALCMTGGHGHWIGREVDNPWEARKAVREQLAKGADCIKLIATGGVLTKGAVPGQPQLSEEEMHAAIVEARTHGMRVAAHAIGTEGIKNALRAGVTSIEHGHLLDDEAIGLFKERGAYLVPTLSAPACIIDHASDGGQPEFVVRKAVALGEILAGNIRKAWRAGVKLAGGSDAGTPFNFHEEYVRELELMCRQLGMSPQEALHAATAVAGELVGAGTGTLTPGAPADALLLTRDVAGGVQALREPQTVIKAGAIAFAR